MKPCLIAIAGPSCSGKTQIARLAAASLQCPVWPLDSYYRNLSFLSMAEREQVNFDAPESLDEKLVAQHTHAIASGQAIDRPIYDFALHSPSGHYERIEPADFVIAEGLFALHWECVRSCASLRVYVKTPHEVCLARKIERDVRERGRTEEFARSQYERFVRPMCDLYIVPSATHAELVLDGEQPLVTSVSLLLDEVNRTLQRSR